MKLNDDEFVTFMYELYQENNWTFEEYEEYLTLEEFKKDYIGKCKEVL